MSRASRSSSRRRRSPLAGDGHGRESDDRQGDVHDQVGHENATGRPAPAGRPCSCSWQAPCSRRSARHGPCWRYARPWGRGAGRRSSCSAAEACSTRLHATATSRSSSALVGDTDDPRPAVAAIESAARREGGPVLANCHGVMHTVGRTYAVDGGLTLADLQDVLPRSNDPGCSAGFAHGLVTGVAPSIDPRRPREAAEVCADAGTRYRRYSCVHGSGTRSCASTVTSCRRRWRSAGRSGRARRRTARRAPTTTTGSPSPAPTRRRYRGSRHGPAHTLCRPAAGVRSSLLVPRVRRRPAGRNRRSTRAIHLDVLCRDLAGLQREACITGAAVIGPADPEQQLAVCAGLGGPARRRRLHPRHEGAEPARRIDGLLRSPRRPLRAFTGATRTACYRWLGKAVAVLTDGAFAREGCPLLERPRARRWCRRAPVLSKARS